MKQASSLLLAAGLTAAQTSLPQGPEAAPFPNVVYPGYAEPYAVAGAQSGQTSPPFYPSPWTSGAGNWSDAVKSARDLVSQMTLAEKVNLTTGTGWETERCVGQTGSVPRLGIRSLCMQDSPVGVRDTDYNSVFPAGGTIAATWDRSLIYQRGLGMGSEHKGKGVDVQLGPVVGPLGRAPEGGRNWEGFSPDPYLAGEAVYQSVQGIQAAGVVACTKHYIGNEQEHFRQVGEWGPNGYGFNISEEITTNVDDRTMHELYLWPFADAVRAGTGSIMCSYNFINGSYGCQNSYTLNHLLKNELDFQGFVMSDWGAQHSGVSSSLAGLDMAMPGDTAFDSGRAFWGTNLTVAVLNGTVPEWRMDDMVTRILAAWFYVGRDKDQPDINFSSWTLDTYGYEYFIANEGYSLINEHVNVRGEHGAEIRNQAAKATVLLKNTNNALPLDASKVNLTAVFGEDAGDNAYGPNGCSDRGCDNGTLGMAWGSGSANFPYLISPYFAIQNEVYQNGNGEIQGITDNYATSQIDALAAQASVSMVFINSDSGEGYISVDGNEGDRNNLTAWNDGDRLVTEVAGNCSNTVVVIHSVGPVLVTDWYDHPNVTAILWAGIPGQESGNSIADVIYGRVNPGGKLPFTIGATRQSYGVDLLYEPNNGELMPQLNLEEGVFIDYRAFDRHNTTPIYEFGFGMSYTNFSYANLQVTPKNAGPYVPASGQTEAAPSLGQPGNAADYVFPQNLTRIPYYQYPYLNSTDLAASTGEDDYGDNSFVPPGATDGSAQPIPAAGGAPGGNVGLYDTLYAVSADITNTGAVEGDEVVQLYLSLGGPDDPVVQLRGFDRLNGIKPGQTMTFSTDLTRRDLSNWDIVSQNWVISQYPKTVHVGASSRNLPLQAPLPAASPSSYTSAPAASTTMILSATAPTSYGSAPSATS